MEKKGIMEEISNLISNVKSCISDESGLVAYNEGAKNYLTRASQKLAAVYELCNNENLLAPFNGNEFSSKLGKIKGDKRLSNNSREKENEVVKDCENFYESVKKFADSVISNSAVEKKKSKRHKFIAIGILGEVLELIVSVISTFIDANWFGWAVVGIRATQAICLVLSLFSIIAFCFDVVPTFDDEGKVNFKTKRKVINADYTILIFSSFMIITLLICVVLTLFMFKGLPIFAPLILLGFAAIVLIAFLVLVYLRTGGRQKNKASKTANVENNSGIVYIDQRDQMRSGNKRTKTTITVLVIFIILFFIISIFVGVFVSKPEFLYGTSTITYEINGVSHSKSVIYGKEYFIEIPTKVGHTFLGLYDKEENGIQVVNAKGECVKSWDSKTKNGNRILFAKWKTNMYTFVYNGNGGAGLDLNNFECEYNEEMPTLASNISRMGYTFAGWSTKDAKLLSNSNGKLEKGKEKLIFPAYDIPLEGNEICLFAVWTAMDNTLIFMSNDGADRSESQIIKTDATTKLNANTFKRDGYNFGGWSTTATGDVEYINSANYTMGAVNATLFAVWTGEIVFNANGGLGEMANQNIKIDTTAPLSNNIFTRVGYSFVGWSTASNATEIAYKDGARYTITTGGATLYAKWEANDYIITFDTDGGNSIANIKAKYGALINLPKATRYKYDTFAFWTNNSTEYVASITMPAKDILMTAKYNTEYTYIKTARDMLGIENNLSGKYMLVNDLNLGEWMPLGTYEFNDGTEPTKPFKGIFDGNNCKITYDIRLRGKQQYGKNYGWGLFGSVFKAEISNLKVSAVIVGESEEGREATSPTAGGIAGWAKASYFSNCEASGKIMQNHNGARVRSGGIVGVAYSTSFTSCINYAKILASAFNASAAGIVGGRDPQCTFANCVNSGQVEANHGAWWFGDHRLGDIYTDI